MQVNLTEGNTPVKKVSNPEFITPSTPQIKRIPSDELPLFEEARSLLHLGKYLDALKLFPETSFVRELITDHLQICKIKKILTIDAGTFDYDSIEFDPDIFGKERESRLFGLHQLKKGKCLNNTLVKNISNHLQDILLDQFQPLKSFRSNGSQIFGQLYQKLNQIQQKFDLLKENSPELPAFIQDKAEQVCKKNYELQIQLNRAKNFAQKYQNEAVKALQQNSQLKYSLKNLKLQQSKHLVRYLQQKKKFNLLLEKKEQQYRLQLDEIREKTKRSQKMKQMQKELDVTIEEFKNLIYKLSLENKLLKEQRDLLLGQLSKVYEKFQIFVSLYQSSDIIETIDLHLPSDNPHENQQLLQQAIISELKQKAQDLQLQIKDKNEIIERIVAQIELLKKQRDHSNNQQLNRSMSINSSSESNEEKRFGRRYKRTKQGEQVFYKISELEELRKQDKQVIESLNLTVKQLTQRIRSQSQKTSESSSTKAKEEPQETSNTLQSLDQEKQEKHQKPQKRDETIQKMANQVKINRTIIKKLEQSLEQEKQTNVSLNNIIEDLHSFQKSKESSVLTPRMLKQIGQLKDTIQSLENQLKKVRADKEQSFKMYQQQVMNLQFQCCEAQLSITLLQNQIIELQTQLQKKDKELRSFRSSQSDTNTSQKPEFIQQLQALRQQKEQLLLELNSKDEENEKHKAQIEDISSKLKSTETTLNFTKSKTRDMEKKYKSITALKQFKEQFPKQIISCLFNGDILEDKPFEKQFLIDILHKRTGKVMRRTKLLWKFDPLNKVNLHNYIDSIQSLVLLAQLEGQYVVGGYYQGKIFPKMIADKDGLLFSLTKKQVFEPIEPNKKVVTYDDYYLIFGNSEIRIRSQESKLFSNFGLTSSFFKARGMKVDVITNSTEKQVGLKYVQVYQLQFL